MLSPENIVKSIKIIVTPCVVLSTTVYSTAITSVNLFTAELLGANNQCHKISSYNSIEPPTPRDDYKFSEMIGQKPLTAIRSFNLIGHPYIALER